jgi:CheY-like chemotaxis protein
MAKALILIVDRCGATRAMYAAYFRHHGYEAVEAADSREGVLLSRMLNPDLVVADLAGGQEWVPAIRRMRGNGTARERAIIACSSTIDPHWPEAPTGIDVDRALPKPTSPSSLLQAIQQLLGHGPAAQALMAAVTH